MQTIATPSVHSADEHSIVRLLSVDSTNQAAAIQDKLKEIFGDAIWLQQPPSLHVTLMQIICDTQYVGKTRKQYFDEWYAAYNEAVQKTLATTRQFDIKFTELLVSQRAIIIKSDRSEVLNDIRNRLLRQIKLPPHTKAPPDITHSTLARFNRAVNLDEAQRLTNKIPVDITERVTEFSLVRDLGPPDFNGIPMQVYSLGRF